MTNLTIIYLMSYIISCIVAYRLIRFTVMYGDNMIRWTQGDRILGIMLSLLGPISLCIGILVGTVCLIKNNLNQEVRW